MKNEGPELVEGSMQKNPTVKAEGRGALIAFILIIAFTAASITLAAALVFEPERLGSLYP
jgi:hypothetical protein